MTLQKDLNALVKKVAAMEGKGMETSVGNIREVIKCLALLDAAEAYKKIAVGAEDCSCSEEQHIFEASEISTEFSRLMGEYRVMHLKKMFKKFHTKKAKSR